MIQTFKADYMGIEPISPPWQGGILADERIVPI